MFTNQREIRGPENSKPVDIDLKLKIQQEKDFMISRALNEGRGSEVFTINDLPDEHFKRIIKAKEK